MVRPTRWLLTVALLAATNLPYAAPLLCRVWQPGMTAGMHGMTDEWGSVVAMNHPTAERCDFAKCATAPVAPPFALEVVVGSFSLDTCVQVAPAGGNPAWLAPPLPPPPKA